ncbi:MAG: hypothetical protein BRC58_03090 [Cyanobacteria bacterium QS_8_64_29]|nr:MAG: hypothetical protein BRC58_03090 [Cyanobacteria bacterium QS_8_64_29]
MIPILREFWKSKSSAQATRIGITDLVRRETGRTVQAWIMERRLTEAKRLLMRTDRSVESIAQQVSFNHTSYFIRKFRDGNAMTPNEWRQSLARAS